MDALTPTQRDLGLQRLRRLTFGATAGGLIAVVGVGYVAASSYAGNSSSSDTALTATTTTDTTASSSSTSSTSSDSGLQSTPTAPTTGSSGSGAVTTGGS
jgi:hypothetical protein